MKAIHVKKIAPTERKGTRFKAMGLDMCAVEGQDYALNDEANAAYVAQVLVDKYNMRYPGTQVKIAGTGTLPDSTFAVLLRSK